MRNAIPILFLCCGAAQAADIVHAHTPVAVTPTPTVAARFETTHCTIPCKKPISRRWELLRDAQTIELRGEGAPFSELWRRLVDGRIDYIYLMHDEHRAIEYSPTDLALIGRQPDWERIGSLVSSRDLAHLKRGAKGRHAGLETRRYTGALGKAKVDVAWIPSLALPAKLQYRYPKQTVTIRLVRHHDAPGASTVANALASYQLVDYADIGDMEDDPQAQVWIRKAVAAPGNLHQGHEH